MSLLTIIGLFVRLTWFLGKEFSSIRKIMFEELEERDNRIVRLEYWAVTHGFQPGVNPMEFRGNGKHRGLK